MNRQITRLVLLDPELGNPGGHYSSYADTIDRACGSLGIHFAVLGGAGSATPTFDSINASYVPRWTGGALVNPFVGGYRMHSQLRLHASSIVDAQTLVFAATVNHRHYAALARWLAELPDVRAPKLAILLRFPEYDATRRVWSRTAPLTRRGLATVAQVARHRAIRLVADSESLADEYRQLTRLPVAALPNPHMFAAEVRPPRAETATRIGYFGEARREKGFDLLVEAIDLLDKSNHPGGIELVVQSYVRAGFEAQGCGESCARLASRASANLRLLEGVLTAAKFEEEFLACDAVVLPYELERYGARNSGIFTDAVAAGIAVIATRGTWMHGQMEQGLGTGLTFEDGDAGGLAEAMIEMARCRDQMRVAARQGAARWRDAHDPARFLGELIELFA